jgi:AcrR family transcriptional regulator
MASKKTPARRPKRGRSSDPAATRAALLDAAQQAFEQAGFDGTDTNRIARAAGFSPQTFYRHFADKLEIFVAVYERWVESHVTSSFEAGSASAAADATLRQHAVTRVFRRDLRRLALASERMRTVRARERQRQLELLRQRFVRARELPVELLAVWLLCVERLADAIVDDELLDLGVSKATARWRLAEMIGQLAEAGARAADGSFPLTGAAPRAT